VLLDNAAGTPQIAPLLPSAPGCLTLVTSRRRLTGLDGVRPESIPVLPDDEAIHLLTRIVGGRAAAEPDAAMEVVRRCGGLPLAIRLAGARLVHRPRWRVADLLRRLGEAPIGELAAEDRTVAAAFALSYQQLDPTSREMFRVLGLYPAERFDALAVAALTGMSYDSTEELLDGLVDVHLLEEPEAGVYRLHDLLREYAAALAADLPADRRREAIAGLLDFQLHALIAAVPPPQRPQLHHDLQPATPRRPDLHRLLIDPAGRLERERPTLASFVDAGVTAGLPEFAWLLPRAAWRNLWTRGYTDDIVMLQSTGMRVAHESGDPAAKAMSANYLASAYLRLGRYDEARRLLERCIRQHREAGETRRLALAMSNLAIVHENAGRLREAAEQSEQALDLCRQLDFPSGKSVGFHSTGVAYALLGRYDEALRHQRLRLLLARDMGDLVGVANSLMHIAMLKRRTGAIDVAGARRTFHVALRIFQAEGYLIGEADVRNQLGNLHRQDGEYEKAIEEHRRAVDIAVRIADRRDEAAFLNDLATTVAAAGDRARAHDLHEQAFNLTRGRRSLYEEARAVAGMGECLADVDPVRARQHWQRALGLFERMGVPDRFEVAERLAVLDGGGDQLRNPVDAGRMDG
jgi:tetratricopeptide (TPR) repeat protein